MEGGPHTGANVRRLLAMANHESARLQNINNQWTFPLKAHSILAHFDVRPKSFLTTHSIHSSTHLFSFPNNLCTIGQHSNDNKIGFYCGSEANSSAFCNFNTSRPTDVQCGIR